MATLTGKVALVTGGSRGIGAAIVRRLAREGADVAFTYLSSETKARAVAADIQRADRRGLPICVDSADATAVSRAVQQTAADLGHLDILVNNAGIFVAKPIDELSLEEFDRTMATNVRAVFVASQAAARLMKAGGRIISIGSCLAALVGRPNGSLYAMSKTALIGLTKAMARDLGPRGITVNLAHPGPTDTDMNPADGPKAAVQRQHIALGHYGAGDDIASLVAYLASAESRFITGAEIAVDGGINA
jgi:3-oxoacyl-[acyl-carrier protein] reductase